jgi:hypothetical protein
MSPDLLAKLIAIPVMLSFVHLLTAAQTDQSLDQLAVSVQYEALRDVAGTTYEESFYNADKSEEGLEANAFDVTGYATPVNYFDYTSAEDSAKEQLLAQIAEGQGNDLSILDMSFSEGINGYIDVLVAGGSLIEEDGSFFENALWGEAGGNGGNYFSGLSNFDGLTGKNTMASSSCQPYAQIQKIQARLKSEQTDSALNSMGGETDKNKKLVEQNNLSTPSLSKDAQALDLGVSELIDAVTTAQQSSDVKMAIAKMPNLDECFIAQVKTVFNSEEVTIAPVKQMPNLAYYNYFFSTTETKANIEDGSASYFLFRRSEVSDAKIEERKQRFESARENISKWNAF